MPEQDIEFDIPVRLRKWAGVVPVPPAVAAMEDAAYEVERLQRELTRAWAAARLTDAEREAITTALAYLREDIDEKGIEIDAAALRGLLERNDRT
jgi:ubiquinone biosynthesis protein UbiJ